MTRVRPRVSLCVVCLAVAVALGGWAWRAVVVVRPDGGPSQPDDPHDPPAVRPAPFLNTSTSVRYVGSQVCAECHAAEYDSWLQTAHSQALSLVDPDLEPEGGDVEHPPSGRRYRFEREGDQLWHREFLSAGRGEEVLLSEFPVKYLIGSGRFSRSYLVEDDGFLVQSPVTWYAARPGWGMSPGYEDFTSGFERPAEIRCVMCHVGRVEPVDESIHRLHVHEQAISCERCHGPGERHVARWSNDDPNDQSLPGDDLHMTDSEADLTIVNPSRLSRAENEAICAQCHLHSAASVEVRGRRLADFRPGLQLTDFQVAYGVDMTDDAMTVVGHVEQLRLSACYLGTETMTCTTCHNPHATPAANESFAWYQSRCTSCHDRRSCGMDLEQRLGRDSRDDCVGCHMPQVPTDIPHFAFTHHRIAVHPVRGQPEDRKHESGPRRLVPLDDVTHLPDIEQDRCLGLAYVQAADHPDHVQHARVYHDRARELLEQVRQRGLRDPEVDAALARLTWTLDPQRSIELAHSVLESARPSPDARATALFVLGSSYFNKGRLDAAAPVLEELVRVRRYGDAWLLLSVCRFEAGDFAGALEAAQQAARISPHRPEMHQHLADLYQRTGDRRRGAEHRRLSERLSRATSDR